MSSARALFVLCVSLAWAGGARAQGAPDTAKSEAQALLTRGNQQVGDGEYLAALGSFEAAYSRFKSPKILLNIGTTLRQLGRNIEAATTYERYLADPEADPNKRAEVTRILGEIDSVVAHVTLAPSEKTATLRLDGRIVEGFAALRIEPGSHSFTAEAPGFVTTVVNLKLPPGASERVPLALMKPGQKPVIVVAQNVGAAQRAIGFTLGGLGVVALGAGVGFEIASLQKRNAAASQCLPSPHFADAYVCSDVGNANFDDASRFANIGIWNMIVGAAMVVAGGALVLTSPHETKPPQRSSARVSVTVGPGQVALRGGF